MVNFDDFKKIEIRAGKILSAEKILETEKLLKLEVSFGEMGNRQIVAGIAAHFPNTTDLVNKQFAFVTNLEHRLIKGVESQGMILATGDEVAFSLLSIGENVQPGSLVR